MLDKLPSELLHKIILYASPLISISITPTPISNTSFETNSPSIISSLARTNSTIYKSLKFVENPGLFSKLFERTFDFDAPRRRLGTEWAGAHGCAWEGRKRWAMIQRMKNAVKIWENDGYHSFRWMDTYGEEEIRLDLWTIYLMLLENDGKNAILLTFGAKLGRFVEMLCRIHFGRRMTRRVGWPSLTEERALLAWILVAVDPLPNDFMDQDLYHQTKLCMRAFIFASFKYPLGVLPPTHFLHPSSLNPSHYIHQIPSTSLIPYALNPLSSARYASWTPPLDPPVYKYSNDNLVPIIIYAHTVYFYPPSLAVAALLWYFCGTGGVTGMVTTPVVTSPDEYSEEDTIEKGNKTPDTTDSTTTSSSPSNPTSATRSIFKALRVDPLSWTTPFLFSIPLAPQYNAAIPPSQTTIPQSTFNRLFRNELYRRRFNAASRQLDQEWTRRLEGRMRFDGPSRVEGFVPGSLEGVWEGGFLFLDFPDYAQFLTGEKEASPDFYQLPPDRVYGSNRQVWRLKEYELQTFGEEGEGGPTLQDGTPSRYASPNYGRQSFPGNPMGMRMDASIGSNASSNMPLSVGKWMDGWLPPAEKLKWQFPEDGGELEIVEILKSGEVSNEEKEGDERRLAEETSSAQVVVTGSSQDTYIENGDEEDEEGWQKEKAGVAGKLRGRGSTRNKNRATRLPALDLYSTTSSATPVARPLAGLPPFMPPNTALSPDSSKSQGPTSSHFAYTDTNLDARTLSPPLSPPVSRSLSPSQTTKVDKGGSKRFSWGWKSRDKKGKKGSKSKREEHQPPQPVSSDSPPPVAYRGAGIKAENAPQGLRPIESTREMTFDSIEAPELDDRSDVDGLDEKDFKVRGETEVVERVSRYVRWDPNVAWAKQAIWGNREARAGGGSAASSSRQGGNVRNMTASTSSATDPSVPGSAKVDVTELSKAGSATSGRGQRQVRDILVFGESHSAWGEASIRGRIRSHDGLITLVKTYPQRAVWIYTGYVVAGECLVGRWRDANSPEGVNGYEGPFAMKRRR